MSRAGSGFPPGGLRMPPVLVARWGGEPYRRGAAGWIGGQDMPLQGVGDEQVITGPGHAVAEDEVWQVAHRLGADPGAGLAETDEPPSLTPHGAGHDQCAGAVADDAGRVRELGQHLVLAVGVHLVDAVVRRDRDQPSAGIPRGWGEVFDEGPGRPFGDRAGGYRAQRHRIV